MFESHGSIKLNWVNDVLVIQPSGQINREGAIANIAKCKEMLTAKPVGKWCRLQYFTNQSTLQTPEALKEIRKAYVMFSQHGCIKVGIVSCNILIREIIENICKELKISYESYETYNQAIASLQDTADKANQ